MPNASDQDYFTRRAIEEMERGEQAVIAAISLIHFELAFRYLILAFDDAPLNLAPGHRRRRGLSGLAASPGMPAQFANMPVPVDKQQRFTLISRPAFRAGENIAVPSP